jgi:glutathione S-transferase
VLRGAGDAERDAGQRELTAALEHIERALQSESSGPGPFWLGSEPSLVDFAFYPWFERWAALEHHRGALLPARFERIHRWKRALSERPSVRQIENPVAFYVERYAKFVQPARQATG